MFSHLTNGHHDAGSTPWQVFPGNLSLASSLREGATKGTRYTATGEFSQLVIKLTGIA